MTAKTVTRADLAESVFRKVGLSRTESAELVETVIDEICNAIVHVIDNPECTLNELLQLVPRKLARAVSYFPPPPPVAGAVLFRRSCLSTV